MAHVHTISVNGKSHDIPTSTHIDDHPNDDSWLKRHSGEISAIVGLANLAYVVVTHKPRR